MLNKIFCPHICKVSTVNLDLAGYFRTQRKHPEMELKAPDDAIKFEGLNVQMHKCFRCGHEYAKIFTFHVTKKGDFSFEPGWGLVIVDLDGKDITQKKIIDLAKKSVRWLQ